MKINSFTGYELEKEQSNSPEDSFTRSEVTFEVEKETKVLSILYVRYFEKKLNLHNNPVCTLNEKPVYIKDITALLALLKNPVLKNERRIYISEESEFKLLFEDITEERIKAILSDVSKTGWASLE
ncbi:hypothetical protein [Pseudalkalibacillus caeni]|uniref:Uncharacterized protein n=1 Tax=Exobacillus caeni TaxID=2574798 RepID=A0A5R9EYW8_9BACL|nr:hypothetical protein [Pseudalkalibacillus caeni]TLS35639.1 hypothetical protein FCL54_19250 [Pseudalkalibacillus caeni]